VIISKTQYGGYDYSNTYRALRCFIKMLYKFLLYLYMLLGRSQWPRGLRHELSSLAETLGSWIPIQLHASMFVCLMGLQKKNQCLCCLVFR
jgi:hypothetical protein